MRSLLIAVMLLASNVAFAQDAGSSAAAARIAALEARVAALEARLSDLEGRDPPSVAGLPSDEEFERTLGFMEMFMRRFIGIAKELDADKAPDRT